MTNCPTCQKPVDPIRSRHVSVRDGKVVAYCSPECLASAQTQPVRTVPEPVAPAGSEPVIQILHEPASGVVTSAADKRSSQPAIAAPAPKDRKAEKAEKKAAEKERRATERRAAEQRLDPAPPTLDTIVADVKSKSKQIAVIVDDEPAPSKALAKAVSPAALAEVAAKPKRKRNRRDSIDAKSAFEWLDDEPAAPVGAADDSDDDVHGDAPKSRGVQVLIIGGLVGVLAVGGYFAYDRYTTAQPAAAIADASTATITNVVAVDPDSGFVADDPAVIRERALTNAQKVLRTYLASTDQMKEKAALALSRARDTEALAYLGDAMLRAGTDTKKLEIAYALARAGDARGLEQLTLATRGGPRDTRLDAGKKLAQLGHKSAIQALSSFIELRPNRYEVAKALAGFGDERAVKALQQMRTGSEDEQARAAIALVQAGKGADLVPEVQAMLTDEKRRAYRHEASLALAEIRDISARPVLLANLGVQQTQVEVARALRRVDPKADLSAQLTELEKGLLSEKDLEQIKAADALLLLAGPEDWTDRP